MRGALSGARKGGKPGKFELAVYFLNKYNLKMDRSLEAFGDSVEGKKRAARDLGIRLPTLHRKHKELDL